MDDAGIVAGKVIAITGAGRGIGAAIARDLAGRGAQVVLGDLDADRVKLLAQELGPNALGAGLDVTDVGSYRASWPRCSRPSARWTS